MDKKNDFQNKLMQKKFILEFANSFYIQIHKKA